jgi:hypothetical protein
MFIEKFRKDNPDYTTPDAAYRDILNLYNDQIDNLREQERLEERARRQQQTIRNRYDRLLGRRINRMIQKYTKIQSSCIVLKVQILYFSCTPTNNNKQ